MGVSCHFVLFFLQAANCEIVVENRYKSTKYPNKRKNYYFETMWQKGGIYSIHTNKLPVHGKSDKIKSLNVKKS